MTISDIVGSMISIPAALVMLFLLWRYGITGLWEIQRNAMERVWQRAVHGRPVRKVDYAYIERTERELGLPELRPGKDV